MIELSLDSDQQLVVHMARGFAARELRPRQRDHELSGVTAAARSAARTAGLADLWSADVAAITRAAALEELAYGDAGAALALVATSIAGAAAKRLGADPAELVYAHVFSGEPATTLPWLPIEATAQPVRILRIGCDRRWQIVGARTVAIACLGLQAAGGARCTVTETFAQGHASDRVVHAIAELRLAVAAMCVGVARASLEYVSHYVQERVTFGKRLADHQAVAFAVSDMAIATAAARMLVHRAALGGEPAAAAHAFVEATGAALAVTNSGVQLLGGHGYLKDHPVEKWMRDARALALLAGGRDAAADDSERDAWEQPWT